MQELKKGNMFFKHYCSRIKKERFSLEKIKNDTNALHYYVGFENYDALIAVLKWLEPKASRINFWQGTDKCKDGNLKYQNLKHQ